MTVFRVRLDMPRVKRHAGLLLACLLQGSRARVCSQWDLRAELAKAEVAYPAVPSVEGRDYLVEHGLLVRVPMAGTEYYRLNLDRLDEARGLVGEVLAYELRRAS
ncbi:MAG: hypothetical protein AAF604_04770 [Acidobacteriota bacterium]